MINKYTEGLEKCKDGRYKLYEQVILSKDTIVKKILTEKITESVDGHELPIYGTYLIKLWSRNDKNKNKRNYHKVFDKVLKENRVTIGFCDHPKDGAESYKDIILVCKNPQMIVDEEGEEWLAVEVTLVGKPYGENCEATLQAGGFLEFSSSALGDVDYNGDVLIEGFFLERYADVVVNSSNAQLFFIDKEEDRDTEPKADTTLFDFNKEQVTEKIDKDILTIYNVDNKLSEKTGEKTMSDKLSEKALELNIKSMIRDADKVNNLFEKKEMLLSALSYAKELPESILVESITKGITEVESAVAVLAEKGLNVEVLNTSIKTLTESKEILDKEVSALKEEKTKVEENYNALIKLYEDKQFEASQTELLTNKQLLTLIETLKTEVTKAKEQVVALTEKRDYFEAMANTKVDADDIVKISEQLKEAVLENKVLNDRVLKLKETIRGTRKATMTEKAIEKPILEKTERPRKVSDFKNEEVKAYYEMLCEEDSNVKNFKESFVSCSSLKEAQKLRMNADKLETPFSYNEDSLVEKTLKEKGYI